MQLNLVEKTILGILLLAKKDFGSCVLRTELVKYLYLVDVYNAECSTDSKETWTGLEWKFYHYGPYSQAVAHAIDNLVKNNLVLKNSNSEEEKEYSSYSLPDYKEPASLKELGLDNYVTVGLRNAVKKYSSSLPELLNYIYYETTPMQNVRSGDVLSFQNCVKREFDKFKPITQNAPLNSKEFKDKKLKLKHSIASRNVVQANPFDGKFDEVYEQGLNLLDLDCVPVGLKGKAQLNTG